MAVFEGLAAPSRACACGGLVARIGPLCRGPFGPILVSGACCRSSVVEHSIGNGEVDSSILSGSTIVFLGTSLPRKSLASEKRWKISTRIPGRDLHHGAPVVGVLSVDTDAMPVEVTSETIRAAVLQRATTEPDVMPMTAEFGTAPGAVVEGMCSGKVRPGHPQSCHDAAGSDHADARK